MNIKKNTLYNVIKTFTSIAFPLITFPYIYRVLLPPNVGKIEFGLSIVSYFALIASLGISTYAIRECSVVRDNKSKLNDIASQIFSINIITTIIAYVILAVFLVFNRKLETYRILIMIQSLSIVFSTLGADWINSAMEDFKYITIRTVVFQFISVILIYCFIKKPEDYLKYAFISLISSAGANISNIRYRKKFCELRFITNMNNIEWSKHFVSILYMFVMILSQTIFNSIDKTMLGLMKGDVAVGIYSTANNISNIALQVVTSLLWVVMPRLSYYFSKDEYTDINGLLRKILGFNAVLGIPCVVGTYMISGDIIQIIAGEKYADSAGVLKILMIGFVFTIFGGGFLGNYALLPAKKEKTFMIICLLASLVNAILNFIFIPLYGVYAAAVTTDISALVIMICVFLSVDRRIQINNCLNLVISPIIGCIGIVISCKLCSKIEFLWMRVGVSIFLSVLLYFVVLFICKNELLFDGINFIKNKLKVWNDDSI